jgi:hypothetical protein
MNVVRDSPVLPTRKNTDLTAKRVFLPGAELGLTDALLFWAKELGVADHPPLCLSTARVARCNAAGPGSLLVRPRSARDPGPSTFEARSPRRSGARASASFPARARQILRATRNLPLAQRQAGWSRPQMAYLTIGDDEACRLMQELTE